MKSPLTEGRIEAVVENLRNRLNEVEEILAAIRNGEVDALVMSGAGGSRVFTLNNADRTYRVFVEEMNQGAVTVGPDGTILYCNRRFAELVGRPLETVIGTPLSPLIAASDRTLFEVLLRRGMDGRGQGELALAASGSAAVPVLAAVNPLTVESIQAVSWVFTDLSDQKRNEELVASEKLARSILDQAVQAMVVCDESGTVIRASRAAHRLCGDNPLLQPFDEAFPLRVGESGPSQVPAADPAGGAGGVPFALQAAMRDGIVQGAEVRFAGRAGQMADLLLDVGPLTGPDGRVRGCIVTLTDISDRKRLEEDRVRLLMREREARSEAETANRSKDEFLTVLSHELRTPLTAVLGWTRMLRAGRLDEGEAAQALETIERNARMQAQLTEDLLDVSRIITGKLVIDARPTDLAAVVASAVDVVRPAAAAKGIRLETVSEIVAPVPGDSDRLQQVVWNLLSNAVKFTHSGGCVKVCLRQSVSEVRISVADNGEGISPAFLPYVFDRFRQADAGKARKHGGLGLGLSIVRHLVELHGGTVQAESEGLGRGATFTVRLPAIPARPVGDASPTSTGAREGAGPERNAEGKRRLSGLRLLVVDDTADTLKLLSVMLRTSGAEVATADSSPRALQILVDWPPDVLVTDIGMPFEDGFSLLRKVRALSPDRGGLVPAVALTGYARAEDRDQCLAAGFQAHLTKPVGMDELVAAVTAALPLNRVAPLVPAAGRCG